MHQAKRSLFALLCVTMAALPTLRATAQDKPAKDPIEAATALIGKVENSLALVEYTLRFDKGEEPAGASYSDYMHGLGERIEEERPYEAPAFILSDNRVLVTDKGIHPRFIEAVHVRFDGKRYEGTIVATGTRNHAHVIELKEKLPAKAKPLAFDASAKGPYHVATLVDYDADWRVSVSPLNMSLLQSPGGKPFFHGGTDMLILADDGTPVTIFQHNEQHAATWKTAPAKWDMLDTAALSALNDKIAKVADTGIVRVHLSLRSPRKGSQPDDMYGGYGDDSGSATEQNVLGVRYTSDHILVLANLMPKVTARLERIRVHVPGHDEPINATFVASLKDHGALIAKLDQAAPGHTALSDKPVTDLIEAFVLIADVRLHGETRTTFVHHGRIAGLDRGRKNRVFAQVTTAAEFGFAFSPQGQLIVLPVAERDKTGQSDRWSANSPMPTPIKHLAAALKDPAAHADPSNVPLSEEEENRMAWLGVELQALDTDLARENKVADETRDGSTGALVTYVYKDSPAEKADIKPGDIILRVLAEDRPKPIDLQLRDFYQFEGGFPWDRLDEVPEMYYDRIPQPWPSANNTINKLLTDIGFGKKVTIKIAREGKVADRNFAIEQSPAHYDQAPRSKSEALGLTVRELTYETRRYLQRKPEDPGLIAAKVEMGSLVSRAGIKPFELITHVNDKPVSTIAEFQAAIDGQTELTFSVKRMAKNRIAKVKLDKAINAEEDRKAGEASEAAAEAMDEIDEEME